MMRDEIQRYLNQIELNLLGGQATEHTHRPALQQYIESSQSDIRAINEPRHIECGAPDFVILRQPENLILGYIETKDVRISLDEAENSHQIQRYLHSLENLILTNYLEFRWYVDGIYRDSTRLGRLDKNGKIIFEKVNETALSSLLHEFLNHKTVPIARPEDLAQRLAKITHIIRDIIVITFESGKASPVLADLRNAFAAVLIPELVQPEKTADFADMYAQTLAYGLFAARCNHSEKNGRFKRSCAASEIPKTNPFLRKLFETITGADLNEEPYVGFVEDLVQVLAQADMSSILERFGQRSKREDPIIHFYETFLAVYDPKLREARGVYYTPEPVVSYIVRSVDILLQEPFGIKEGLADAEKIPIQETEKEQIVPTKSEPVHRMLILDPACGTGTFLYAIVDHIREQFMERGDAGIWSGYVKNHLLPRLFGFELLMAPYAIAHFKLGMQLAAQDLNETQSKSWAFDFSGNDRIGIYLTNTLEEAERKIETLLGPFRIITEEAQAAARIKKVLPILVILGNPPYSNFGMMNKGKWILKLLEDYKKGLHEKKINLNDDFIKFIRWSQWRVEKTGSGILALITNNTYLDGITHRRMRESLLETFTDIYILDLHGSSKKKEICPDGSKDENVFDIQQGVSIGIFVKSQMKRKPYAQVHHAELWGLRKEKYSLLENLDIQKTPWTKLKPKKPFFFFVPKQFNLQEEYANFFNLKDLFLINQNGIKTDRDHLFFDFDRDVLIKRMKTFFSDFGMDNTFRETYKIKDSSSYDLLSRRKKNLFNVEFIQPCLYRPFDQRWLYYAPGITSRPAWEVMRHIQAGENLALIGMRQYQYKVPNYCYVFVTRGITECRIFLSNRGIANIFPLYLYPDPEINGDLFSNGCERHANLSTEFCDILSRQLRLSYLPNGQGNLKRNFGPEDVFHYIYALLHSSIYRKRYAEFLQIDYPRIPLIRNRKLFHRLCILGSDLVEFHLLESKKVTPFLTHYPIPGSHCVEKGYPKYIEPTGEELSRKAGLNQGRVYINPTQYFEGISAEVWNFYIGGYQVCEKWLKDRRGITLNHEDLVHYQKIIASLMQTTQIMEAIDREIEKQGGWEVCFIEARNTDFEV